MLKILEKILFLAKKKNENRVATTFNSSQPIKKLNERVFSQKTEVFSFNNNNIELDINQKVMISEYVKEIKNKPIKIQIIPSYELSKENKKLMKTRLLLIRAQLIKLGISHNRIKLETKNANLGNTFNEVIINFIEM